MVKPITVYIDEKLLTELDKHCRGNRSHVIREYIKSGMETEGAKSG